MSEWCSLKAVHCTAVHPCVQPVACLHLITHSGGRALASAAHCYLQVCLYVLLVPPLPFSFSKRSLLSLIC